MAFLVLVVILFSSTNVYAEKFIVKDRYDVSKLMNDEEVLISEARHPSALFPIIKTVQAMKEESIVTGLPDDEAIRVSLNLCDDAKEVCK